MALQGFTWKWIPDRDPRPVPRSSRTRRARRRGRVSEADSTFRGFALSVSPPVGCRTSPRLPSAKGRQGPFLHPTTPSPNMIWAGPCWVEGISLPPFAPPLSPSLDPGWRGVESWLLSSCPLGPGRRGRSRIRSDYCTARLPGPRGRGSGQPGPNPPSHLARTTLFRRIHISIRNEHMSPNFRGKHSDSDSQIVQSASWVFDRLARRVFRSG